MKLVSLPNLRGAVSYMASVNGFLGVTDELLNNIDIPEEWKARCCLADTQADELSGIAISSYVNEGDIDRALADPTDDCVEVLCDGEESVRLQLVEAANCKELDDVLASFFDGELNKALP